MELHVKQTATEANLSLYWNDRLVYHGRDGDVLVNVDVINNSNNSLVLECERLSANQNFGQIEIHNLRLNNLDEWPVKFKNKTVSVPFSLLQGCFYTEESKDYLSDRIIYTNSYQRIHFRVENNQIVDHYYDRGDENNPNNWHSIKFITQSEESFKRYHLMYSEIYNRYVHRLVHQDHCMFYADPSVTDTYSSKWLGVKIESTKTALEENLARYPMPPYFPGGSDFLPDLEGFKVWPFYHVFGAYYNKPLPKEVLDLILEIV